ncbi:hypothetical protein LTR37_012289 [Vermiconidia calcicola]|uniref:Uncharacterized protein n=1 Tax=Vermiconidia calcicola TaxID=1690605 RepID=A0ACC3N056_9PEZI|nr:hypothetical protein LTR37_012289 [Vermiconidia calcicola]
MIPPPFGWSAGDVATAVQILAHVLQAFHQTKGAKKQYAASRGFLRQLVPVVRRIRAQREDTANEQLHLDLADQYEAINVAYETFDEYLEKKYNGLSAKNPSKAREILQTIKWSLDELHGQVQKLKSRVNDALPPYQALMVQELCSRVARMEERLRHNTPEHQRRLQDMQNAMTAVSEQLEIQEEFAKDNREYRACLLEELERQGTDNTSVIRSDLAAIRAEMQANHKAQLQNSEKEATSSGETHLRLLECQKQISKIIERQRLQAQNQTEAAEWARLQAQAQERTQASEAAQKMLQINIKCADEALGAMRGTINNDKIKGVLGTAQGGTKVLSFWTKLGLPDLFNDSQPNDTQRTSGTQERTLPGQGTSRGIYGRVRTSTQTMSSSHPPRQPYRKLSQPPPLPASTCNLNSKSLLDPFGLKAIHPSSNHYRNRAATEVVPPLPPRPQCASALPALPSGTPFPLTVSQCSPALSSPRSADGTKPDQQGALKDLSAALATVAAATEELDRGYRATRSPGIVWSTACPRTSIADQAASVGLTFARYGPSLQNESSYSASAVSVKQLARQFDRPSTICPGIKST